MINPLEVHPGADCKLKGRFPNRLAAENALADARRKWRRDPSRAAAPPIRIYQCERCDYGWHMTSAPKKTS